MTTARPDRHHKNRDPVAKAGGLSWPRRSVDPVDALTAPENSRIATPAFRSSPTPTSCSKYDKTRMTSSASTNGIGAPPRLRYIVGFNNDFAFVNRVHEYIFQ